MGAVFGSSWTINGDVSKKAFFAVVSELYEDHKYLTFSKPRIGADRSIDQNSLFHVWLAEYAAHLLNKTKQAVTRGESEGMKRTVKARFTQEHPDSKIWMTHDVICPLTKRQKIDYTSSKDWKSGEMFAVLTWLQMMAANSGLILEAKGQFAKNQRKHNGE